MIWLALIVALAFAALYVRERNRRRAETLVLYAEADRYQAMAETWREKAGQVTAERDQWAAHAGEARGDAQNVRRELDTARQDFEMRGRSQSEAVCVGQRREKEAADLLRDALTLLTP